MFNDLIRIAVIGLRHNADTLCRCTGIAVGAAAALGVLTAVVMMWHLRQGKVCHMLWSFFETCCCLIHPARAGRVIARWCPSFDESHQSLALNLPNSCISLNLLDLWKYRQMHRLLRRH